MTHGHIRRHSQGASIAPGQVWGNSGETQCGITKKGRDGMTAFSKKRGPVVRGAEAVLEGAIKMSETNHTKALLCARRVAAKGTWTDGPTNMQITDLAASGPVVEAQG